MLVEGIDIIGITCNPRKVKPQYAFVAIKLEELGGEDIIKYAIKQGATIIFIQDNYKLEMKSSVPVKYVEDITALFWNLCNKLHDYPFEKLKIIGVAGTNGKTTTAKIIRHILMAQGVITGFISAQEICVGKNEIQISQKCFDVDKFFEIFNSMIKMNVEIVLMEVDDRYIGEDILYKMKFDTIVYTNIETEFMNKNIRYLNMQKRILKNLVHNGMIIINTDDSSSVQLLKNIKNRLIITYGLCSRATITASSIEIVPNIKFNCCIQRGITPLNDTEIDLMEFPVQINLLGRHNVYNTLAAITVALMYGVLPENIMKEFEKFKGIKRRMHKICEDRYYIIDDMSHNPDSFEAMFETIQSINYENLYIVNAIIGNENIGLNKYNAKVLCNWVKGIKNVKIITTGSADGVENKDQVLERDKEVFHKILEENEISYIHKEKLKDALKVVLEYAKSNDLIVLTGERGMDKGEIFIKELLKEKN